MRGDCDLRFLRFQSSYPKCVNSPPVPVAAQHFFPAARPLQLHAILGVPEVDCAVDAVGFEARGCGNSAHKEVTAQVHFFSLPFG